MIFNPSTRDLGLMGFRPSRSKRRMVMHDIIYHIKTRTFYIDGIKTDIDDEGQLILLVKNRTPKDASRDNKSDL